MPFVYEILPEEFSQGSTFGRGFNTKVISLDNDAEYRVARSQTGRRRYTVNLNIWSRDELYELYKFYIAVARGTLNSFLMKDWFDYASTTKGTTFDSITTAFDQDAERIGASNRWRVRKAYQFGSATNYQLVQYLVPGKVKCSIDNVEYPEGIHWTVDTLNGTITVDLEAFEFPVDTVRCGYEHYVRVRFEKEVDSLFQVALHGTDTAELPSISLVEDITPVGWSQDYPMGGARAISLVTFDRPVLNQFYGRVWYCSPQSSGTGVTVPSLTSATAKAGGPHFVVYNGSSTYQMTIWNDEGASLAVLDPASCCTLWIGLHPSGGLVWICA